jgi:KUP system potassium uptake protein
MTDMSNESLGGTHMPRTGRPHAKSSFWLLTVGSVGVVYGDIGTSPLYAFREALHAAGMAHGGVRVADIIGILSLIIWSLTLIVTIKYVLILLRADNNGEGGTLSLMALAQRALGRSTPLLAFLGMCGASLFYGDAIITPAISVLSAVEGLKLVTPEFGPYVIPIALGLIVGLFAVQSRGTAKIAIFYGPVTALWFIVSAIGGIIHIADDPAVFYALNPYFAVQFLLSNGLTGLIALGAVFLAVTGAEGLYADLGHFGRKPIQTAWLGLVFPALALNYMGQGALVLANPEAAANPFFLLFPQWALLPVVLLATVATIIASQAVITGAYSLTRQAVQLHLLPRLEVRHTSEEQAGQIYMPQVNALLMIGVLLLVLIFGSSSRLATAYGISVTGTMLVTGMLLFIVIWKYWKWSLWVTIGVMLPFIIIECVFLGANLTKLFDGGFVPLLFALCIMFMMRTWVSGSRLLFEKTRKSDVPLAMLIQNLAKSGSVHTTPGTAVFLTSDPDTAPTSLLHSLKHYKVLHEKNVLLTIITANTPHVNASERVKMEILNDRFSRVSMTFGYMDTPNVPAALGLSRKQGWKFDIMSTSFFLSRRSLRAARERGMPIWQDKLFIAMANNSSDATAYFSIPTGRVVEIGAQITI